MNGSIINLEPISSPNTEYHGGAFTAKDIAHNNTFFYNPCKAVDQGEGTCDGETAVCQIDASNKTNSCGSLKDVKFTVLDENTVNVTYTGGFYHRETNVVLICDKTASLPNFEFREEDPPSHYHFSLTSRYCCPGAKGKKGSSTLSGGSIFLIALASLLVVYIVAGILFQKYSRGAQGKELIPNHALWFTLPGLIKDGVLFVFGKCGRAGKGYDALQ
jgi:hypothetical protein